MPEKSRAVLSGALGEPLCRKWMQGFIVGPNGFEALLEQDRKTNVLIAGRQKMLALSRRR